MSRILVFGTGSVGSVYACILNRAGCQVTCVCRSNYLHVQGKGLKVLSPIFGNLECKPVTVRNVEEALASSTTPFDFVVICTKATIGTTLATIEAITPAVIPSKTAIVIIQNGLGIERPFHTAFPQTTIISGVAYIPTTEVSPGIYAHSEIERLHLGIYALSSNAAASLTSLSTFSRLLKSGGATALISDDIQRERWTKIVANGAINPICALSRCRDRQLIESTKYGSEVVKEVMAEIVAVAASVGYGDSVNKTTIERQLARSLERPYPGVQPSMMADVLSGRALEVRAIAGEVVEIAQQNEVSVPRLMTLLVLLEGLEIFSSGLVS
jgi:2-dehydropantoate 2-reductase